MKSADNLFDKHRQGGHAGAIQLESNIAVTHKLLDLWPATVDSNGWFRIIATAPADNFGYCINTLR